MPETVSLTIGDFQIAVRGNNFISVLKAECKMKICCSVTARSSEEIIDPLRAEEEGGCHDRPQAESYIQKSYYGSTLTLEVLNVEMVPSKLKTICTVLFREEQNKGIAFHYEK